MKMVVMANQRFKTGHYAGNKWGGKFLRAPDIFYTILEKGKGKLVELGKIAKVRRGFTTGANEFFYLDEKAQKEWNIEKEFLKPIIKSPKECESIIIDPRKLKFKVFLCNKPKSELKGTNALKYIEWGEQQKTKDEILWCKVPSVSGRKIWYDLGIREPTMLNFNYLINEVGITFVGNVFVSDNFHQIETKEDIAISMNSSFFWLFQNVFGRKSFGGGLLKIQTFELEQMYVIPIKNKMPRLFYRPSNSIFEESGIDPSRPIREQEPKPLPDRAELDNIVFDELGLTEAERKEVYWAVCELVKQRLDKAGSLRD